MSKGFVLLVSGCAFVLFPMLITPDPGSNVNEDLKTLQKYQSSLADAGKGMELLAAGDREGALKKFAGCLAVLPDHPDAAYGRAVVSSREDDLVQALLWIERAEAGCRSLQSIWKEQTAGRLSMSREEQLRLRELVTQGIDRTKNSVFCDAQSLIYNKTARQTQDVLRQADGEVSPFAVPAEFFALHGNILFKMKRLDEAEAQYIKALDVNPGHERCLNNLVNIYYVTRRLDLAREWLKKAGERKVSIHPKLKAAVLSLKGDGS